MSGSLDQARLCPIRAWAGLLEADGASVATMAASVSSLWVVLREMKDGLSPWWRGLTTNEFADSRIKIYYSTPAIRHECALAIGVRSA
jgi:hypothetical protein